MPDRAWSVGLFALQSWRGPAHPYLRALGLWVPRPPSRDCGSLYNPRTFRKPVPVPAGAISPSPQPPATLWSVISVLSPLLSFILAPPSEHSLLCFVWDTKNLERVWPGPSSCWQFCRWYSATLEPAYTAVPRGIYRFVYRYHSPAYTPGPLCSTKNNLCVCVKLLFNHFLLCVILLLL